MTFNSVGSSFLIPPFPFPLISSHPPQALLLKHTTPLIHHQAFEVMDREMAQRSVAEDDRDRATIAPNGHKVTHDNVLESFAYLPAPQLLEDHQVGGECV